MKIFIIILIVLYFVKDTNSYININKCKKKIGLGIYLFNLRMKPYSDEIQNKKKEIYKYSNEIRIRKEMILRNNMTKNSLVQTTLDSSYQDFFDEISEIIYILVDINKDAVLIINSIIREYFKYNMYEELNRKFDIKLDSKDLFLIIVRNIIIPTFVHDSFQSIFQQIKHFTQ